MDINDIKNNIQLAMNAVKDIPESFKTKAFEIVLSKLLEKTKPEKITQGQKEKLPPKGTENPQNTDYRISKLAEAAGITVNQLKDLFQFEEQGPVFIGRVSGTEAEKQFQISRLTMLVFKDVYEQEWVRGSVLWKILKDYGVGSLDNLSANLTSKESEIRAMGQKRGRKYKLTEIGRQNALVALKQFVVG